MSQFDDRERAEEAKYAKTSEMDFKVMARRNRLLGDWAAEKLGLTGDEAAAYAKSVVMADFEEAGDDDVLRKVHGDLAAKGLDVSEHVVRREMDALVSTARNQLAAE